MTANKPITAIEDSLVKLRSGGAKVSASIAQLTQSRSMTSLHPKGGWRDFSKRCWLGFQESRSKPVGELIPDSVRHLRLSAVGQLFNNNTAPADQQQHRPVVYESVVNEPGVYEPVVNEPFLDNPIVNEPIVCEPVVYENGYAGEEPIGEPAAGSALPMAIIVAGLGGLTILAILQNGPSDDGATALAALGNETSVSQVATLEPSNGAMSVPTPPTANRVQSNANPDIGPDVSQPMQLAATMAPVVFETGADPKNTKLDPPPAPFQGAAASIASQPTGTPQAPTLEEVAAMQMLKGENKRLKEMMAALEYETLSLNSELLKLELSLSQAEKNKTGEPEPVIETRTVYNFVNVPVGGAVELNESPAQYTESYNNNSQASYVDNTYRNSEDPYLQSASDPAFIAELPAPEMGFSSGGQFMPSNAQLYPNPHNSAEFRPDPYMDQNGYMQPPGFFEQTDQQLYGSGADIQYGPANQSMDARRYPPVPPPIN